MTTQPDKPTCNDLIEACDFDDTDYEEVDRNSDPSWRHGTYETAIFRRKSDTTFWQAKYRRSTDGETNELRDGLAKIEQVFPKEVTHTIYETNP